MLHLPSNYDNDKTKQKSFVHISQIVIEKLKRLLTARSLPKLEDPGSNSVIGNYNWTYLLLTVYREDEHNEKEARNGHL